MVLEVVDLFGHVGVAEIQGGVCQVDHELRGVLGLGEHGLEVSRPVVHGCHAECTPPSILYERPIRTMARMRAKASRAGRCGVLTGSMTPRCSLLARRLARMPPRAPVSSRKGGTRTSRAGKARNECRRFSIVNPATTSMSPAISSIGSDSRR